MAVKAVAEAVETKNSVHTGPIEVTGAKRTKKEESNNGSGSRDATVTT
jgi:hypothetical protein